LRNHATGAAFSWHLDQGGENSVGNKFRWLQALIILSALVGVLAVQSARSRPGVLAKVG
jgi:hypothetical protein